MITIGPELTILIGVALVIWGVRLIAAPRRKMEADDIDLEELEAAEREVRELGTEVRPDDDVPGADWGPGTPRPPTLL